MDPNNSNVFVLAGSANPCSGANVNSLDNPLANVQIYPNPANQTLFVDVKELQDVNSIEILDLNGKQIVVQNKIQTGLNALPIEHLNAGMYQVRISQYGFQITKPLIKQ